MNDEHAQKLFIETIKIILLGQPIYIQGKLNKGITKEQLQKRCKFLKFIDTIDLIKVCRLNSVESENEGLYINGHKIDKLSSLSSFNFLVPNNKDELPHIIGLGDIHSSIEGGCELCSCHEKSNEKCCYHTFDSRFLQLIDSLGDGIIVKDIYVEGFDFKPKEIEDKLKAIPSHIIKDLNLQDVKKDLIIKKMKELKTKYLEQNKLVMQQLQMFKLYYDGCYNFYRNKKLNHENCPTRYTRWQLGDIRQNIDSIEKGISMPIILYKNIINKYEINYYAIDSLFTNEIIEFNNLLLTSNIKKFIDKLFNYNKSYIVKQIKNKKLEEKLGIEKHNDYINHSKTILIEYIIYIIDKYQKENEQKKYKNMLLEELNKIEKRNYYDINNSVFLNNEVQHYWIGITSWMTDMYIYFRMKKQQMLYNKSILSTLVLGDNHICNMIYFLTNITKEYTLKIRIESSEENQRCINLKDIYLNLNDYIPSTYKTYNYYESQEDTLNYFQRVILGNRIYYDITLYLNIKNIDKDIEIRCDELKNEIRFTSVESMKKLCRVDELINQSKLSDEIKRGVPITIDYKFATNKSLSVAIEKENKDLVLKLIPYCEIDKDNYEKALETITEYDCTIAIAIMKNYKYHVDFPLNFDRAKNNAEFKLFLRNNINNIDFSEKNKKMAEYIMNRRYEIIDSRVELNDYIENPEKNYGFNMKFNFD